MARVWWGSEARELMKGKMVQMFHFPKVSSSQCWKKVPFLRTFYNPLCSVSNRLDPQRANKSQS